MKSLLAICIVFLSSFSWAQDQSIEGHDFYAVSCDVEFLNIYSDTVVFYSNQNKKVLCDGQEEYDAYVYYFGPNGMLMYGSQSKGETTAYKKGAYQINKKHLVITEDKRSLKFKYWLEEGNLVLVRKSKVK